MAISSKLTLSTIGVIINCHAAKMMKVMNILTVEVHEHDESYMPSELARMQNKKEFQQ